MLDSLTLAAPPQVGRVVASTDHEEQAGFWTQIQAAFRGLSGTHAAFANDPDPDVRALGQTALRRRQPAADDYFTIGDRCAVLTLREGSLSSTYAVKAIVAYDRARQLEAEDDVACDALFGYTRWVADAASHINTYDAIKTGMLVNERLQQMNVFGTTSDEADRLRADEARLAKQLNVLLNQERAEGISEHVELAREARALRDRGHLLLRLDQPEEALVFLERALQINDESATTWLLCATALSDLGRYDDAITAYDRALMLRRGNATAWNSRGTLLLELGRLDQALDSFDKALAIHGTDTVTTALLLLNKGKALYMLKRYEESEAALERSHAMQPSPESAAGIAACHELQREV